MVEMGFYDHFFLFQNSTYFIMQMIIEYDNYKSKLFKRLLHLQFIRNQIFSFVKIINRQECVNADELSIRTAYLCKKRRLLCDYNDLGCYPDQLIKYGYHERYKQIFNTVIRDQRPGLLRRWYHRFYMNYLYYHQRKQYDRQIRYEQEQKEQVQLEISRYSSITKPMSRKIARFQDYNESDFHSDAGSLETSTYVLFKQLYFHSLRDAARIGALDLIECVFKVFPDELNIRSILEIAVQHGHLPIVEFFHNNVKDGSPFDQIVRENSTQPHLMDVAARYGQLDILKFLHFNRTEGCSTDAYDFAATNGHLNTIKFLHHHRTEGSSITHTMNAACFGHLDVLIFIHNNLTHEVISDYAFLGAIRGNHIEVVRFLLTNRTERPPSDSLFWAARTGNLEMLKLFLSERYSQFYEIDNTVMDRVAQFGRLEIVQFLHENTTAQCGSDAMDKAAEMGHLDVIKFLHFNRTEGCSLRALHLAIANKHLDVVRFLVEVRHMDIDQSIINRFSNSTSFPIFKYLYEIAVASGNFNIEPANFQIENFVREETDPTVFNWLNERGFQFSGIAYNIAIDVKSKVVFQWLHENTTHQVTNVNTTRAISSGCLPIVEYLNEVGAPFPEFPMDKAFDLPMLIYLHRNRTESLTIHAMDNAINRGDIQMIKYLKENNFVIQKSHTDSYRVEQNSLCIGYNSRLAIINSLKI
ncbi:hypothetical protein PPL_06752 [Heterostelium album PN500]|uniref:Ankyrin repeat-containing protein n=1 Tax=Heterostelium pallidum (strain ATCC 26659 / Pp 5 / PN500) TaxID=670386 RepID=D3BFL7_HETP5|nr:hypothetical protein PPL_06752 [Heterostelium album PN500]EFA79931.1 hypothetical protein PPL_06752 [Heterostelium album PN500]|eukprot:XP_020432051.1 hypothetical protein PPL_06752 [Heterostelium album PN500]